MTGVIRLLHIRMRKNAVSIRKWHAARWHLSDADAKCQMKSIPKCCQGRLTN